MQIAVKSAKDQRGFTLLELMVLVAITGIMASIAVTNYSLWNTKSQLKEAAKRIQSQLALARMAAMNRNTTVTVSLAITNNRVTVVTVDANTGNQIFPVETLGVHVVNFTGGPIQFSSQGVRAGGGVGAQFITVQSDSIANQMNSTVLTYTVQVLPGGKATWCASPAPTCGASL